MNRQAVPSILLSVAIVCFFAVTLYQRDGLPQRSPKSDIVASKPATATGKIGPVEAAEKGKSHATRPLMPPADQVATTAVQHPDQRKAATTSTSTAKAAIASTSLPSREPVALAPGPSIQAVSTRAAPSRTPLPSDRPRPSGWKPIPAIRPDSWATGRSGNR